jgi:ribosome-associated heat shock protein Hsp15
VDGGAATAANQDRDGPAVITLCDNAGMGEREVSSPLESAVRLDVWLDVACLFGTRSEAQRAVRGGKVDVNGESSKPHRVLHLGDRLTITRGGGRRQQVVVRGLLERHVAKAVARQLYDDVTPALKPEQLEARRIERLLRQSAGPRVTKAPDRRERRALRALKGQE